MDGADGAALPAVDWLIVFGKHLHWPAHPLWQLHRAEIYHVDRGLWGFTRKGLRRVLRRYPKTAQSLASSGGAISLTLLNSGNHRLFGGWLVLAAPPTGRAHRARLVHPCHPYRRHLPSLRRARPPSGRCA